MDHAKIHGDLVARYGQPVAIDAAGLLRAMGLRTEIHPRDACAIRYATLEAATAFATANRECYGHTVHGPIETEVGSVAVIDFRHAILNHGREPTDPALPDKIPQRVTDVTEDPRNSRELS